MREILFRGKRLDNGEWVYGYYAEFSNHTKHQIFVPNGCFEVDPSTIGQFTGLTDKDGKRIFEGDIVEFEQFDASSENHEEWDYKVTRDVVTMERFPKYWLQHEDMGYEGERLVNAEFSIIIGNIYDNPELLK